jgi:hypothetical protein
VGAGKRIDETSSMTPVFLGQISSDGKLSLDKKREFEVYKQSLAGQRIQLTVEKMKHSRTSNQNRYYHGVVVKMISALLLGSPV